MLAILAAACAGDDDGVEPPTREPSTASSTTPTRSASADPGKAFRELAEDEQEILRLRDGGRSLAEIAAKLESELKAHVRAGLGEAAVAALERGGMPRGPGKGMGRGEGRPKA